jgi:hypothetical protein
MWNFKNVTCLFGHVDFIAFPGVVLSADRRTAKPVQKLFGF